MVDVGPLNYFLAYLQVKTYEVGPDKNVVDKTFGEIIIPEHIGSEVYPDIIVIQSESFSDPTEQVPLESFSEDPLPFYHELRNESLCIDLSVPVYGGGTAATEGEMLLSLPYKFFGQIQYTVIDQPHISLGSVLREQGYYSLFMHPFLPDYYNRDKALYELGFNQYMSQNDLLLSDSQVEYTQYMSDIGLNESIIAQLEQNPNRQNFIMAVSMQNHTPFINEGYELPYHVYYEEGIIPTDYEDIFTAYLSKLRYTDDSLRLLVDYLRTREKPTMLIFYGDHKPFIGEGFGVMNQIGWQEYNSNENNNLHMLAELYNTPCIIWSNYQDLSMESNMSTGIINLGEIILEKADLDMPNYYYVLRELREEGLEVFSWSYAIIDGELYPENSSKYNYFLKKLEVLWGDVVGPYKYLETDPSRWVVKDNLQYVNPTYSQ